MNRLVKVTGTDGVVEAAFVYDRTGFLVKELNAADYLSADTDEERTGTYYTYDYEGNVWFHPESPAERGKRQGKPDQIYNLCYKAISDNYAMFQKRWADHDYHEEGGESLAMVEERNIEALYN